MTDTTKGLAADHETASPVPIPPSTTGRGVLTATQVATLGYPSKVSPHQAETESFIGEAMKASRKIGTLAILTIPHLAYFLIIYAPLSLSIDRQSRAIEEILRANLSLVNASSFGFEAISQARQSPNRALGCSLLLMESLYRDCKSVVAAKFVETIPTDDQISKLLGLALPIAQRPCEYLMALPEGKRLEITSILQCRAGSHHKYRVTLSYLGKEELHVIGSTNGEVN